MKILLAEDERSLSRALTAILTRSGYSVDAVFDGEEALEKMESESYDAFVLDIMMPKIDGITVLKNIRESGNLTPAIMLTAKSEVEDKVTGLEAGANDYLTKPFNSKELIARIQAMTGTFRKHPKLSFGNVTIDKETLELSTPTGGLRLANREFQLLEVLMNSPNSRISAERLKEKLWSDEPEAEEGIVNIYISYLRKKLAYLSADVDISSEEGYGLEQTI